MLRLFLSLSRLIDAVNLAVGRIVYWLVLVAVLISAANATSRYALNISSNAWLESQWYLYSAVFLLCGGYTFLHNEHVRIDVVVSRYSKRYQAWIDVLGIVFFLLPMAILIGWLSLSIRSFLNFEEISGDAGGLVRWPVRLLIPVGFFLLALQGISELIRRVAFLSGSIAEPTRELELKAAQSEDPR